MFNPSIRDYHRSPTALVPLTICCLAVCQACAVTIEPTSVMMVECNNDTDCPVPMRCVIELARCAKTNPTDTTAPMASNIVLSPTGGAVGDDATLQFTVSESLLAAPQVTAITGAYEWPWLLADTSADNRTFVYTHTITDLDPEGAATIVALLVDQAGNADNVNLGTFAVDRTGPAISGFLLAVASNPPGTNDAVAGLPGATEAGATVEVYDDISLTTRLGTVTAAIDGGFTALDLGDNFTDETVPLVAGQATFFLRALDLYGNAGETIAVITDIEPPLVPLVALRRVVTVAPAATDRWLSVTRLGTAGASLFIDARTPVLAITAENSPNMAITCSLTMHEDEPIVCRLVPDGSEPEDTPSDIIVRATKPGSRNVAERRTPIEFDFTPPVAPNGSLMTVDMQPAGQVDHLAIAAGGLEPNAVVEVFGIAHFVTPNGPGCNFEPRATYFADANGSLAIAPLEPDTGNLLIRQFDAAGNASCEFCSANCAGAAIPVGNDEIPPVTSLTSAPPRITELPTAAMGIDVRDVGPINWQGAMVVSNPVTLWCRLDGAAFAPCTSPVSLVALAYGGHTFDYFAKDALLNTSTVASYSWRIQRQHRLLDAPRFDDLTPKALIIDGNGFAHIFVGGDKLYHIYQTGPTSFTTEIIDGSPAAHPVAARFGTTFAVAYARRDPFSQKSGFGELLLAVGHTSDWVTETAATWRFEDNSWDLAWDHSGTLTLGVHRCAATNADDCFVNGQDARRFELPLRTRSVAGVYSAEQLVPGADFAIHPRLAFTTTDDLWLAHERYDTSGDHSLKLRQRTSSGWQPLNTVPAISFEYGAQNRCFSLLLDTADKPGITFRPTTNGAVKLSRFDGSVFSTENLATSEGGGTAIAVDDTRWFLFPLGGGMAATSRTATASWATNNIVNSTYPDALSVATRSGGAFASVSFDAAARTFGTGGNYIMHVAHAGAVDTTTTASTVEGVAGFTAMRGATKPSVVYASPGNGMWVASDNSGVWSTTLIRNNTAGRGGNPSAVTAGTDAWVAHESGADSATNYSRIVVERFSASAWSTFGAITADGVNASKPYVDLRADGVPVVAYAQGGSSGAIFVTWWDGAQFKPPTQIATVNVYNLSSLAVLADPGASASGPGDVWVFHSSNAGAGIEWVRLNTTSEDGSCTTCVTQTLDANTSSPVLNVGRNASNRPQLTYLGTYNYAQTLNTAGHDGAQWNFTNISSALVLKTYDFATNTWKTDPDNYCFAYSWATYGQTLATTRLANGRNALGAWLKCSTGDWDHYSLVLEQGDGSWAVYPFAPATKSYVSFSMAALADGNNALLVWPSTDVNDVWTFSSGDL